MKFTFHKTQLVVAVAVAAVFGITTAADAASFVRVPTVANAQISNGGTSPATDVTDDGSGEASPAPHTSVEIAFTRTSQRAQAPASVSCALGASSVDQQTSGVRKNYDTTSATPVTLTHSLQIHCTNSGDADVTVDYAISSSATSAMVHAPTGDQISYSSALTGVTSGSVVVPASQKLPFPPYTVIASNYSTGAVIMGTVPAGQTVHGGVYEGVATLKLTY